MKRLTSPTMMSMYNRIYIRVSISRSPVSHGKLFRHRWRAAGRVDRGLSSSCVAVGDIYLIGETETTTLPIALLVSPETQKQLWSLPQFLVSTHHPCF